MKKLLTLLLALALVLTALVGCAKPNTPNEPGSPNTDTPPTPSITDEDYDEIIGGDNSGNPGETNPPEDNPPVDNPPEDNPPTTEAPEGSQVASGFLAKQKKYNYGENNIVMLNVTNQNTDNYSVKVEGYYLDADGAVLKTETKFVEGYAAGYVKDFLFNPGIAFDSFKFTLTAEKFSGECYEDDYFMKDLVIKEGYATCTKFEPDEIAAGFEHLKNYPVLWLLGSLGYHGTVYTTCFDIFCIIIDSNGDIYAIFNPFIDVFRAQRPDGVNTTLKHFNMSFSEEDVWPEELRDGYQVLYAFNAWIENR